MTLNRRNFLRTSLSGAAITLGAPAFAACVSKAAPDESASNKKVQTPKNKAVLEATLEARKEDIIPRRCCSGEILKGEA